jgi:hypothetical protein
MTNSLTGVRVRSLIAAACLLLASTTVRAGDFDGAWIMNANGWTFTLKIEEKDGAITGTMTGINNEQKSTIEGKVKGTEITFKRDNDQEYRGYLLSDDPTGKTNKLTIAGIFKSGEEQAGWYAKR